MTYFDLLRQSRNAAIYAYLHSQLHPHNFGRDGAGGEGCSKLGSHDKPTPGPTPDPDPIPSEPVEYDMTWYLVHDDATWHEAYDGEDSPLKKYYANYPEEDLWNGQRSNNFNDRHYEGTIDDEDVSCNTTWAADGVQKITVNGVDYYCEIWGYNLKPKDVKLFYDVNLSNSADKVFKIFKVSFPGFEHDWKGAINAAGAVYPWIVVDTKDKYDLSKYEGKIELQYNGNTYYPFKNGEFANFSSGYAIEKLPDIIGIDPIDADHTETIDPSELTVKGYVKLS